MAALTINQQSGQTAYTVHEPDALELAVVTERREDCPHIEPGHMLLRVEGVYYDMGEPTCVTRDELHRIIYFEVPR